MDGTCLIVVIECKSMTEHKIAMAMFSMELK